MPAYYFHVRVNGTLVKDPDGIDLPDLKSVRDEVSEAVLSIFQEEGSADFAGDWEFQIEDASGRIVLIVPLGPTHSLATVAS